MGFGVGDEFDVMGQVQLFIMGCRVGEGGGGIIEINRMIARARFDCQGPRGDERFEAMAATISRVGQRAGRAASFLRCCRADG